MESPVRHRWQHGGVAAATVLCMLLACGGDVAPPPDGRARDFNVLVVTWDTVRADHIGCYGRTEARTPVVDALASAGVRYAHAIAPAPLTLPSHATIFTGLDPPAHGARDNGAFRLDDEHETLAEALREAGYLTGAFVGAYVLDGHYGLDQGFELYDDEITRKNDDESRGLISRRDAGTVTDRALTWLARALDDPRPFFAWVHCFDAHQPYVVPPEYGRRFATPYDGAIAYLDDQLGRIVQLLRRRGAYERTLIVFTTDHGEGLGEHDEPTHGRLVYDTTVRVPLVLSGGAVLAPPRVVDDRAVGLCDVLPTVLDLVGVRRTWPVDGVSLARPDTDPTRALYVEALDGFFDSDWAPLHGLRTLSEKFIAAPRPEYYDLRVDPGERNNLLGGGREHQRATQLAAALDARLADLPGAEDVLDERLPMSREQVQRLADLGYTSAGAGGRGGRDPADRPDPKDVIAAWFRTMTAIEQSSHGDPRRALRALEAALSADPRNAHGWQRAAVLCQRLGRIDRAVTAIQRALDLYPTAVRYVMLAQYLLSLRHVDEAERVVAQALEMDPTEGSAHLARGQVLCARSRWAEAIAAFETAIELDPAMAGVMARRMMHQARLRLDAERRD